MAADGSAYVVVPKRPGPLLRPAGLDRERGEIDELLDDLFGEPTDERSGKLDAVLIAGGGGLAVAALVTDAPAGVGIAGAALAGLGLILPVRDAWRSLTHRRAAGREEAFRELGYPLDVRHPETARLAAQYDRVAAAGSAGLGPDALEAAHLAMVEVAGLLGGRAPGGAEAAYVATRADALADLAGALDRAAEAARQVRQELESLARDAGVAAVRDLDEASGAGAIERIDAVRAMLERDVP